MRHLHARGITFALFNNFLCEHSIDEPENLAFGTSTVLHEHYACVVNFEQKDEYPTYKKSSDPRFESPNASRYADRAPMRSSRPNASTLPETRSLRCVRSVYAQHTLWSRINAVQESEKSIAESADAHATPPRRIADLLSM